MKSSILRKIPGRLFYLFMVCCLLMSSHIYAQQKLFYQLKVYRLKDQAQQERVDHFLKTAYVPALHKAGIKQVGVFRSLETDTSGPRMYVLIPFHTLDDLVQLNRTLLQDKTYLSAGSDYLNAAYDHAPYERMESIILEAFPGPPQPVKPELSAPMQERIYELRSYEGPTEQYHASKIKMFTVGNEIGLFKRLNFNGIFYTEVISGSHMPNLMYMTSFNNMEDREKHWKAFFSDPEWKKLSAMPEYQHNVSKANIFFLHPADYSDL
ncbi:NIPSNAP family protein [Compostibacter hankyongensis]|uniref:NIPSNAP family protein n=1 Tax=Compostibacter hankyongensis TaxID=1007089 RepID=A0ABP8G7M5_9BACT